jgi:hypothetical protein
MFVSTLAEMHQLISDNSTIEETLDYIFFSFMEYIPYDFIHITIRCGFEPGGIKYYSRPELEQYKSFKKVIKTPRNISQLVPDSKPYIIIKNFDDYLLKNNRIFTKMVLKAGIKSAVLVSVFNHAGKCIGGMLFSSLTPAVFNDTHAKYARQIALEISRTVNRW